MADRTDILRLRVLLCFRSDARQDRTVTGIAKTLGQEKYTISRILKSFAEEGLVDKTDIRRPFLTDKGREQADYYADRIEVLVSYLLLNGVDAENARNDALAMALYCSEPAMDAIRTAEARARLKSDFQGARPFSGTEFCEKLPDGVYPFPFVIYRTDGSAGNHISMANAGFEHPCNLVVEDGIGTLQLVSRIVSEKSGMTGDRMQGKVSHMEYFVDGEFVTAEKSGNILSVPASALQFVSLGSGAGLMLHGSVDIQIAVSVGEMHMPVSTAIFTLLV